MGTDAFDLAVLKSIDELKSGLVELTHLVKSQQPGNHSSHPAENNSAFPFSRTTSLDDPYIERPARPDSRLSVPDFPDPRLVRRVIRLRQARNRFFESDLFADPAWDMLLDLTVAHAEFRRVSITSLCIASGVPPTTALRWVGQMVASGMLIRTEDPLDRRRAFIGLSTETANSIARYFAETRRIWGLTKRP